MVEIFEKKTTNKEFSTEQIYGTNFIPFSVREILYLIKRRIITFKKSQKNISKKLECFMVEIFQKKKKKKQLPHENNCQILFTLPVFCYILDTMAQIMLLKTQICVKNLSGKF